MDAIFNPSSVVVIGASEDPERIGGRPVSYLLKIGFPGKIWAVNPNRSTVQGVKSFPSVAEIEDKIDLAIVALPAKLAVDAVRECAQKGVRAAIIFSSGFTEMGSAGADLQRELTEISQKSGMRILGPNCLGALNLNSKFIGTFTQAFHQDFATQGEIAVVSQSGACGGHLAYLCKERSLGIGYWATTGNEADVDVADCIKWLARSPNVKVITVYVETVRNGRKFTESLKLARDNQIPVVILKVGRSNAGAAAARSHTGALTGHDEIFDAVIRQYGAIRVRSLDELLDVSYACAYGHMPLTRRLGIISVSGGIGVLMADEAEGKGLEILPLSETAQRKIREIIPFAGTINPVDITAQAANDKSIMPRCLDIVVGEGEYSTIIMFHTSAPAMDHYAQILYEATSKIKREHPNLLVVLVFTAPNETVQRFVNLGCLVFEDVSRAVNSIAHLVRFGELFREYTPGPTNLAHTGKIRRLEKEETRDLDEFETKRIINEIGIPVLNEFVAKNSEAAREIVGRLSESVGIKILSPDIQHKSEIGGVKLDISTADEAAEITASMLRQIAGRLPKARIRGVLISPMIKGGVEVICGVLTDETFGTIIMFGLGGIWVEVLKDRAYRIAPIDMPEAKRMIKEVQAAKILEGYRGHPRADIDALARAISRLSEFAYTNRKVISELEVNPLLVMEEGSGVYALDALMVP